MTCSPGTETERETSNHSNAMLQLSEGATSLNLSHQALDEGCTQACMCKPARDSVWCAYGSVPCSDLFLCYVLEAHVDAIRCFCSTLKSVNTGSRGGGRDTQEEQERVRRRDRGKRGKIWGEKHQAAVALILFRLIADYQWIIADPLKWYWHPNLICPLRDPLKQIPWFNLYL